MQTTTKQDASKTTVRLTVAELRVIRQALLAVEFESLSAEDRASEAAFVTITAALWDANH
jgi:hypothetical protein